MSNRTRYGYFAAMLVVSLVLFLSSMAIVRSQSTYTSTSYHIVDIPDVLPASEEARLANHIQDVQTKTGLRIWAYIDDKLDGVSINTYSQKLFDSLFVGGDSYDNGILVVIMTGSRKMAIRTGSKARQAVTDAECAAIIHKIAEIHGDDWPTIVHMAVWGVIDAAESTAPVKEPSSKFDWFAIFFVSFALLMLATVIAMSFVAGRPTKPIVPKHPEDEGTPKKTSAPTRQSLGITVKMPKQPVGRRNDRMTRDDNDAVSLPLADLSNPLNPLSPFNPLNMTSRPSGDDEHRRSSFGSGSVSYDPSPGSFDSGSSSSDSGSCGGASGDI